MLQEGQTFGEFEILASLGRDGDRATYKARQISAGRIVALKVLGISADGDAARITRFRREAQAALVLDHPDLVRALASGETDGLHWIVLEFVEGTDALARLKRKGKLALAEAVAIATHVATALEYGWRTARMIHGGIEPRRILLSRKSEVKLAGLGFGYAPGKTSSFNAEGSPCGTAYTMSPERAEGKKDADLRADIYSLGCTLFHLISGEPPYQGDTALAVVLNHVTKPVPDLRVARPECPAEVSRVVMKMMHKLPAGRHQSYDELIADLRLCHEAITSAAAKTSVAAAVEIRAPAQAIVPSPPRESLGVKMVKSAPAAKPPVAPSEQPKTQAALQAIPDFAEKEADEPKRRFLRKPLIIAGAALLAAVVALACFGPWKKGEQLSEAERADRERAARRLAGIPDPVPAPTPAVAKATPVPPKPTATPTPMQIASATPPPATPKPTQEPKPNPTPTPVPAPAPAPTVAQSATAKWIAEQEPQWQAAFGSEVTAPFEKAVADLNAEYLRTIEREIATLPPTADRITGQAFRAERARMAGGGSVPAEDESMAPQSLRTIRANYRPAFAKLDSERAARARAVHARTDAVLAKAQAGLVQQQRPAEAMEIQAARNSLRESWLKLPVGPESAAAETPAPTAPSKTAATPAPKMPKLAPRDLVERLLAMDAAVSIGVVGSLRSVTKIEDLPRDKFSIIKVEFIPHEGLSAADLDIIEQLNEADELQLTGVPATDATLRLLHSLPLLRTLWLRDLKEITAAGVRSLAALPSLTTLNLRGSVGAESLGAFAANRRLDSLTLSDTTFSDKDFAAVAAIPALKSFTVATRDPVVPAAWARLVSAKKLSTLNVEKTPKTAEMISHIGRCAALASLSLGDVALPDSDLAPLTALKALQTLKTTEGSTVDGGVFAAWPANSKLKTLTFPSTASVTDKALRGIGAAFPLLTHLELHADAGSVTSAGILHLQKLKHLSWLALNGDAVDPAGLSHLGTLTEITYLDIGSPRLTDADVRVLAKFTGLRELEWANPPVTDLALKGFARLHTLKEFKVGAKAKKEDTDKIEIALPTVKVVP